MESELKTVGAEAIRSAAVRAALLLDPAPVLSRLGVKSLQGRMFQEGASLVDDGVTVTLPPRRVPDSALDQEGSGAEAMFGICNGTLCKESRDKKDKKDKGEKIDTICGWFGGDTRSDQPTPTGDGGPEAPIYTGVEFNSIDGIGSKCCYTGKF